MHSKYAFVTCSALLLGYVVSQWLGIRLQMLGVIMVTCVSFIAVLEHHFGSINPGERACDCGIVCFMDSVRLHVHKWAKL